ncbi:UNVERIFIED_ORG: hypothetical protein GGD51_005956 [Rhizobium esperanzae]|uniref:hypothetical protein n=1 Tax=Rhizobium phaseoli TaxID=396 RepID=UPI0016125478|nr:hypothetical protein [Rhizobium phaseoli]
MIISRLCFICRGAMMALLQMLNDGRLRFEIPARLQDRRIGNCDAVEHNAHAGLEGWMQQEFYELS